MNFTTKLYTADRIAALPSGLVDYEVVSVTKKDEEKVAIACLFRFGIGTPDTAGAVEVTECTQTYNKVAEPMMAKSGEMRVTVAAKDQFLADMAKFHSAYGAELAAKIADDAETAKIAEDLKGAVRDEFSV